MIARVSMPIFENDAYYSGTDASAFVNTGIRRKDVEVSCPRLTEQEVSEMDEAKSRELTEWIQDEAIRGVRGDQKIPESRLMPTQ